MCAQIFDKKTVRSLHASFSSVRQTNQTSHTFKPKSRIAGTPNIEGVDDPVPQPLNLGSILSNIRQTAFRWDLQTDRMTWASNAPEVLEIRNTNELSFGAGFHRHLEYMHARSRHAKFVQTDPSKQVGQKQYRLQYCFKPMGALSPKSLWVEEHGYLIADQDGRLIEVAGMLRIRDQDREDVRALLDATDYDPLTGLLSRSRMHSAIENAIDEAKKSDKLHAFLLASVDNLMLTNDTFGFSVGDEVVTAVGRRLANNVRTNDVVGRYSTNKFAIILKDCNAANICGVAQRLLEVVRRPAIETSVCRVSATVSIAGLLLPKDVDTASEATACTMEVIGGLNPMQSSTFQCYSPDPTRISKRKRNVAIAEEVMSALDEDRMRIALQPIVRTDTLEIAMFECLLRMEQSDGSLISAGEFMPLASQLGLSRLIDQRVLELAVARAKENPQVCLSLNISSLTAANQEWLMALETLTRSDHTLTNRLTIEITETEAIQDLNQSVNFVDTLKEIGCRVAIDDFGAGYTSFRNLRYLGVDIVKIDGSFVEGLVNDEDNYVFVEKLSELAHHFGIETVAEWVGDQETAEILKGAGITYLQGFYFGTPMIERRAEHERLPA